jgi:putative sterol carrier protein
MSFTATDEIKKSIDRIFKAIPGLFIAEKAKDVNGAYQVIFTDVDYPWHTFIEGTKCSTHKGMHPNPIVTMSLSSFDFTDITYGRLNETMALMKGKFKIKGNLVQAVKYSKLFYKLKN